MNALKHSIHPYEFLHVARFSEVGIPADITDEIRGELKDTHPSMFIGDNISFMIFKVTYSYTTCRGNYKEGYKFVFLKDYEEIDQFEASIMVETMFTNWVDDFNHKYPFRAISNVRILDNAPFTIASLLVG